MAMRTGTSGDLSPSKSSRKCESTGQSRMQDFPPARSIGIPDRQIAKEARSPDRKRSQIESIQHSSLNLARARSAEIRQIGKRQIAPDRLKIQIARSEPPDRRQITFDWPVRCVKNCPMSGNRNEMLVPAFTYVWVLCITRSALELDTW